ncbi:MAG TPA: CbiX/SirB N-terminal domain-containing protein [Pseudonocardia sp.]|uniref:sirohydrochlorin chelatase n=1 Tax=Pseudonocardia sp. TaxID=60912 RepID=UPI002EDB1808
MPLLLVAHGTREEAGAEVARQLAEAVQLRLPEAPVRLAFADVRPPTVGHVLPALFAPEVSRVISAAAEVSRVPEVNRVPEVSAAAEVNRVPEVTAAAEVILVPAFLAAGYHVRRDLPAQLAAAGVADRVRLTPVLGADPRLVAAAEARLRAAGWRRGDATVLAAAGSSDPSARAEVAGVARVLGRRLGCSVRVGYLAGGAPSVGELVTRLREERPGGRRRVAVASWLLAPGVFQRRLLSAGADVSADPLGVRRDIVDAVLTRYWDALAARAVA